MARLTQDQRNQAIGMLIAGMPVTRIARHLHQNEPHVTTFMQDNATPHTALAVTAHLANLGIPVLPWPAKSPDLNPIEHLWDELERKLRDRPVLPRNLAELRIALTEEWNAIPMARIVRLVNSMRGRCQAIENARGGHTRY